MFGLIDEALDFVDDFVDDPIETTARTAKKAVLQPVNDVIDLVEGLSEGEIRQRAAIRLGTEVVAGSTIAMLTDYLADNPDLITAPLSEVL